MINALKSCTFSVYDVETVRTKKELVKPISHIESRLALAEDYKVVPLLYCSDWSHSVIKEVFLHPLIAAVHIAFAEHRPLVLSPDMIWIAILQGLSQHVQNNADELRSRLVEHSGRIELAVVNSDIFCGSPESAWDVLVEQFAAALDENAKTSANSFVSNFSTTGKLERLVSQICILDMFEPFFDYVVYCSCGIPEITLEGSSYDWKLLNEKIELLQPFELDWWLPHLREITDQFYQASIGNVDLSFWKDIYKQRDVYGYSIINGWMTKLIPYIKNGATNRFDIRNNLIVDAATFDVVSSAELPSGLAQVPFKLIERNNVQARMQFLAGFVGVQQLDDDNASIRPKLGWAVRKDDSISLDFDFNQSANTKIFPTLPAPLYAQAFEKIVNRRRPVYVPADFYSFYSKCNGLLRVSENDEVASTNWLYKVRGLQDVEFLPCHFFDPPSPKREDGELRIGVLGDPYLRFLDYADGSFAVLKLSSPGRKREHSAGTVFEVARDGTLTQSSYCFGDFVRLKLSGFE